MCIGGMSSMIQQEVYSSAVAFPSCLYRASGQREVKVNTFLGLSWTCTQPYTYAWPLRLSGVCCSKPLWTSQSLGFSFKFWRASFINPNLYRSFWQL